MVSFLFKAIKSEYLIALIIVVVIWIIVTGIYQFGYYNCNKEFTAYKQTQLIKTLELENKYREQEKVYSEKTQDLVQQISESQESFTKQLNAIEQSYSNKLLESERRANLYKQMSSSSNNSSISLADYTARLDRTIVQGRQLVKELRATIELRDQQLKQCGEQLKLMEKAYARADAE